jgi:hypothetical protein
MFETAKAVFRDIVDGFLNQKICWLNYFHNKST